MNIRGQYNNACVLRDCILFLQHDNHHLVEELAVRVGTEQSLSHSRQSIVLQQRQPRVKGVVDLDFASSTNDEYTASTVKSSQPKIPCNFIMALLKAFLPSLRQRVLLVQLSLAVITALGLVLLRSLFRRLLHRLKVRLPCSQRQLGLVHGIHALQHKPLERCGILGLILGTLGAQLLARALKDVVEQLLPGGEDLETRLVGDGRPGDLLRHGGLLELLLVGGVDGVGFLADELGFFDGKLFVGLDFDLAGFLGGFLTDESRHLTELLSDLIVGGEKDIYVSFGCSYTAGGCRGELFCADYCPDLR